MQAKGYPLLAFHDFAQRKKNRKHLFFSVAHNVFHVLKHAGFSQLMITVGYLLLVSKAELSHV